MGCISLHLKRERTRKVMLTDTCVVVCVADVCMVMCVCKGRGNKLGDVIYFAREELQVIFALFSLFFLLINLS